MVFASTEFLFFFFPLYLLAQALIPNSNLVLLLFSLLFYWIGEGWYCSVIGISLIANYYLAKTIDRQTDEISRKRVLGYSLIINIAPLIYFKYSYFIASDLLGIQPAKWMNSIHLPLGISFFTFHAISYLIDIYRKDAKAERSLTNLGVYMLMFPQLIAGPILRFHTVADQLKKRTVSRHHIFYGFGLLVLGLAQKTLLADTLAGICDPLFKNWQDLSSTSAWLAAATYTLQIYFDFSGYSNMAIGLGWITGFHFPQNFNYPYIANSITDFWQRWHMSLSRWFRDYLYIPMGGNRASNWKTYRNLFIVFLLCGLWHGAAWTFIIWGIYHGLFLVLERMGLSRIIARCPKMIRHLYTLVIVICGWVFFRADSVQQAIQILKKMFIYTHTQDASALETLSNLELATIGIALIVSTPIIGNALRKVAALPTNTLMTESRSKLSYLIAAACLLPLFSFSALKIMTSAYSPFIYFRF